MLRDLKIESHLVLSKSAKLTVEYELSVPLQSLTNLASRVHPIADIGACLASGSFKTDGMIIAPCSMHSLACIAGGITDNLLTRAADVTLKERRRLVLLARESPLHLGHLRNMVRVTEMGAIVAPPVPGFYARPQDLEAMVDHTLGRILDLFEIDSGSVKRWREDSS